jgi:hypothetical protein
VLSARLKPYAVALGFFCLAATSAIADGPFAASVPVPASYAAGFESIQESESEELLRTLVEGEMSGRGTGQEGYLKAARWFASKLESYGFQPAGTDGTWFQNVPFIKLATRADECRFKVGETECIAGKTLGISDFAGVFTGSLPVTFAVVTSERPEIADGACSGRLLVLQSAGRISWDDAWVLKARPACLLVVEDEGRVRNEAVNQSEQTPSTIPVAMVTREAANALAAQCGAQAEFFAADGVKKNLIVTSTQIVDCQLAVERESIDVPNVVGWYPGTDASVSHEYICVGAHLDHLGFQRGELFPGADDNGSGSAAILQVAKAIHTNPVKPRRSVLLMAFCAEERGLLGSKHFVANPLKPLGDMVCMLNIDMIGRNEESGSEPASENENTIHLVGSRDHSSQLHDLVQSANESVGFVFEYDEEDRVDGRSDHASFSGKGIPVTFLFGGFNPYYHKTTDTMDGINFSKIANAARLDYLVLMMASEHGRFALDAKK